MKRLATAFVVLWVVLALASCQPQASEPLGAATGSLTVSGATALNGGLTMDSNKFVVADSTGAVTTASTIASAQTKTSQTTENTGFVETLATDSTYLGGSDITYSGGVGSSGVKAVTTYTGSNGAVTNVYSSVTNGTTMSLGGAGVMAVKGVATNTAAVSDGNIYGAQFIAKHNHATNKMANEAPLIGVEGWAYDSGAAPAGTMIGGNFGFHNEGTTAKDAGAVYRGVQIFADNAAGSAAPSESTGLAIWNQAGTIDNGIKLIASGSGFTKDITLQNGETIDNATNGTVAVGGALSATGLASLNGGIAVDTSLFTVEDATGQVVINGLADADAANYDNLLLVDHDLVGLGTKDRVYGIDVEMTRAAGYGTTNGDHDDAGLKIRMVNKATDNTAGTTLRGVDVNVKNDNPGGSITNLSGGVFTSQIDNGAGATSTVYGLQGSITANDAVTDSSIVADFRTLRQAVPDPTTEYIVQVRNGNTIGTGVDAGLRFLSEAATVGDYGYVIDMNDAAAATADIRLSQGETIDNLTDGTINMGGAVVNSSRTLTSQSTENNVYAATLSTDTTNIVGAGSNVTYSSNYGSSGVKAVTTYTGSNGAVTNMYSSVTTTNAMSADGAGVMAVKGVATNTGAITDGNVYGGQFIAKHNHATNKMANEAALVGLEGWAYDSGAAPAGTLIGANLGFHNEGTTAKDGGAVYRGVQIFTDNAAGSAAPSETTGLAIWNIAGTQDQAIKIVNSGAAITRDITLQNGETIDNATNGSIAFGGATVTSGTVTHTPQGAVIVTPDSTIAVTSGVVPLSAAGTVGTATITGCNTAGRVTVLYNTVAQQITITDTATIMLNGNAVLNQYDTLTLLGDGTNCLQLSKSDN